MACADLIGNWASGVWLVSLGSSPNVSALSISGFACQPSTIGTLNSLISTCYSGSGFTGAGTFNYDVVPDLTSTELSILELVFLTSYYNGLAQSTVGWGGSDGIPWVSVSEGDTRATRANAANISQTFFKMAQEATMRLKYMANVYIQQAQGSDAPRQVLYPSLSYPTFSASYWGL